MSLLLSGKVRKNSSQHDRLGQTLDIGNMFKPTFAFKNSHSFQFKDYNHQNKCKPRDFYLHTQEQITLPHTSPDLAHNLFNDRLWAPLL